MIGTEQLNMLAVFSQFRYGYITVITHYITPSIWVYMPPYCTFNHHTSTVLVVNHRITLLALWTGEARDQRGCPYITPLHPAANPVTNPLRAKIGGTPPAPPTCEDV